MGGETPTACSTPPKKQMANQLGILDYVSPSPIVSANNSQFTSSPAPLAVLVHDPAERSTFKTSATMLAVYELLTDPTFKAQQQSSDRLLDRDLAGCFSVYPKPSSPEVEEKVCDWVKITSVLWPKSTLAVMNKP
ncbi:hypothetical protein AAHC03_04444 [Spirometra sp. Aus1]